MLVDNGTAQEYAGSMEDYIDFVLGRNQPKKENKGGPAKKAVGSAQSRAKARFLKSELASAEKAIAKLQASLSEIDKAMYEPANASAQFADKTMSELLARRAEVSDRLASAESEWLAFGEQLDAIGGA